MPKVSVIIPAYNAMAFLPETLESVRNQTFTDYEVLIINDGSTDNIVEWSSQIQDTRVKLIDQENKGLSGARNSGIWHSQGEYLAFLDADDVWEKTKLEKQVELLDQNLEVGLVSTWVTTIDSNGELLELHQIPKIEGVELKKELFKYNIIHCGSTPLIRRCCFERVGFFASDLSGAADWDMWLRIARYYPISVIQESLVYYRQHTNNMSKKMRAMLEDVSKVIQRAFEVPYTEFKYLQRVAPSRYAIKLAWESLTEANIYESHWFIIYALTKQPRLILSISYMRLFVLINAKYLLGHRKYTFLHSLLFGWKQKNKANHENVA